MKHYPHLFSKLKVGRRELRNRIVLAPMGEGMANPDGSISEQMIAYYTEYAKGGCAIVTPGVISVDYPYSKPEQNIARIDDEKYRKNWARLAENIHHYGGMLIPQIHHAGAQTHAGNIEGNMPRCVSDIDSEHMLIKAYRAMGPQHELTIEEIKKLEQKFIDAAYNCKCAKCDGISLHAAHGYLINQFLSRATNARMDEYGGSLENRVRFPVNIIKGIRKVCGPDFIISARIPGKEWVINGLTEEECVEIAKHFEAAGCDYLDVSGGNYTVISTCMETEQYPQGDRVPLAEPIKKAVSIPVGTVGKLRKPDFCEQVLADGKADIIVMGRSLICDPYWPKKAKAGKPETIRPCISCFDGCTNRLFDSIAVGCALNPRTGREFDIGRVEKTNDSKKVLVIGGGLGGMEAAITAASIGHQVTLLEKTDILGGQLLLAAAPPNKDAIDDVRQYYIGELNRQHVEVKINCEATLDVVKSIDPDAIIVATGAKPVLSIPVPGVENAVQAWDVLAGSVPVPSGRKVAIIGGGIVGCEVAEMVLEKKNEVSIIEMLPSIANGLEMIHMIDMQIKFAEKNVNVCTNATVKSIAADSITFVKDDQEQTIDADLTVLAVGQRSVGSELVVELEEAGYDVNVIGDAKKPAKFIDATQDGYFAGLYV